MFKQSSLKLDITTFIAETIRTLTVKEYDLSMIFNRSISEILRMCLDFPHFRSRLIEKHYKISASVYPLQTISGLQRIKLVQDIVLLFL